jgi:hypothetical protein
VKESRRTLYEKTKLFQVYGADSGSGAGADRGSGPDPASTPNLGSRKVRRQLTGIAEAGYRQPMVGEWSVS